MISSISLFFVSITIIVSIGLPLGLMFFASKKYKSTLGSMIVGAAIFIVFALIFEQMMHYFVFSTVPIIQKNNVLFVLYACLASGIFEELGRYVGLSFLKNKEQVGVENGLGYGIGHGGAEAIIITGLTSISTLILMLQVNKIGAVKLIESVRGNNQVLLEKQLSALTETSSYYYLIGGYERVVAIVLHIALSLLIWMVVMTKVPKLYLLVSILLHAISNLAAGMYQSNLLASPIYAEVWTTVLTLLISWFVYHLYQTKVKEE